MLRITLLSGKDVASLPLAELSDVKALKQRLYEQHGLPPRFRQKLLHEANTLEDAVTLASVMESQAVHGDTTLSEAVNPDAVMDLRVLILEFSDVSHGQRIQLTDAARAGIVDEAGQFHTDNRPSLQLAQESQKKPQLLVDTDQELL